MAGSGVRRHRRARLVAVVVLGVAVLAFVALSLRLFVFPDLNAPRHVDAIAVLGGPGTANIDRGEDLARQGDAPTIVFSLTPYYTCGTFAHALPRLRVLCFRPNPSTTQGEARAITHLAAVHGWHRIIVVMPTTQATRARLRLDRCYSGQVLEVASTPPGFWSWLHGIVYEWGALLKALVLQTGC